MDGAKYKVGETVVTADSNTPRKVTHVMVAYRLTLPGHPDGPGSDFYYQEKDVLPYVRPLAVGDRVRWKTDHDASGIVRMIEDGEACYRADSGVGLIVAGIGCLERIPTEAGQ